MYALGPSLLLYIYILIGIIIIAGVVTLAIVVSQSRKRP